ncbi:MAG: aminopeptidase P family protein [Lachnospiraceae bacterium]|nr:aminopeptidase P family protein [Lachnospiraceae bacterium]
MEKQLEMMKEKLRAIGAYPLKAEAELSTRILKDRLEQVLPWAMAEAGVDFWAVIARENHEDPLHKTLYTWDMPLARRVSIMIFCRDAASGEVEKYYLGMACPSMTAVYKNPLQKGESVWDAAARLVKEHDPKAIAVNRSRLSGFCDGISSTLYEQFKEAIGEYADRVVDGEGVSLRWLERVTPLEIEVMKVFTEITQDVVKACFSRDVITPGVTTTDDVSWAMRDLFHSLGVHFWFGPDVNFQRKGSSSVMTEGVIQPGDLLHCDIGFYGTFVKLYTDVQWVGYVLGEEETEAPAELQDLLDQGNRFRRIVMDNMEIGLTGNQVFMAAMESAQAAGLRPWLYSHTVGTFGHGAGPVIGMYDNQGFVPGKGELKLEADMVYALELNVCDDLACWDGQTVYMYIEENICQEKDRVYYLAEQQKKLILI